MKQQPVFGTQVTACPFENKPGIQVASPIPSAFWCWVWRPPRTLVLKHMVLN